VLAGRLREQLTQVVVCAFAFRTGDYRDVPQSLKYAVETEYGMTQRSTAGRSRSTTSSPRLGGSNGIANLTPNNATSPRLDHQRRSRTGSTTSSAPTTP
jgi:hypothetical protein